MKKEDNIWYATNTNALTTTILNILEKAREEDGYIVDRNRCINFGSIFRDGAISYSNLDLFCERIYSSKSVTVLKKDINVLDPLDKDIIDCFNEAYEYIETATASPSDTDKEKLDRAMMISKDLEPIVKKIEPVSQPTDIPFFVNKLTKEEFPLVRLKDASDENLKAWAETLTRFVEVFKASITPAAFSPAHQPDGLCVMKIKAIQWSDIVIR